MVEYTPEPFVDNESRCTAGYFCVCICGQSSNFPDLKRAHGTCWNWIRVDDTMSDVSTLTNKMSVQANEFKPITGSWKTLISCIPIHSINLRAFSDPADSQKMWKTSVKDIDGDILCVSQFTLLANTTKGNKPDFHRAMTTELSRQLYSSFLEKLRQSYSPERIHDGKFGAMMNITLTNDGPVTFTLDSRKFEYIDSSTRNSDLHSTPV